jgi:hypothetical protein
VARSHRPGRRFFARLSIAGVARRLRPPPRPLGDSGPAARDARHVSAHARRRRQPVPAAGGSPGRPAPLQQELTDFYNLDEPWFVEFATYVRNVVTLEFGPSLVNRDHSVDEAVEEGFPVTAELILLASAWAVPVGILLGLFAAVRRGSLLDHLATSIASVLLVVPVFFVTYVLSRYLVLEMGALPGRLGLLAGQGSASPRPRPRSRRLRGPPDAGSGCRDAPVGLRAHRPGQRASATARARAPRPQELGDPPPVGDPADVGAARHGRALRRGGLRSARRLETSSWTRRGRGTTR